MKFFYYNRKLIIGIVLLLPVVFKGTTNLAYLFGQINATDYKQLNNLTDFEFTINHPTCRRSDSNVVPKVLIFVYSNPENYEKRTIIRDTWGYHDPMSVIYFLLGSVPNNETLQSGIIIENSHYNDIIQGNFIESERNLTYKRIMALKFLTYHCPDVEFVVKTYDDVFLNTPCLYHIVENGPFFEPKNLMLGSAIYHSEVVRYPSRWQVDIDEYAEDYYPAYLSGTYSNIISSDVAIKLYQGAQVTKYVPIEDAFITGIVRAKFGIPVLEHNYWYVWPAQKKNFLNGKQLDSRRYIFGPAELNSSRMQEFWDGALKNNFVEKNVIVVIDN